MPLLGGVRATPGEENYAVAVSDTDGLFLFLRVKRSAKGEYFVFMPRPSDSRIDAHVSYHEDGKFHVKTHEKYGAEKFMTEQRQRPDCNFIGSEHLLAQRVGRARGIASRCDPAQYTGVFRIAISELDSATGEVVRVSVDLVSDGADPELGPGVLVRRRSQYGRVAPFIAISLYEVVPANE